MTVVLLVVVVVLLLALIATGSLVTYRRARTNVGEARTEEALYQEEVLGGESAGLVSYAEVEEEAASPFPPVLSLGVPLRLSDRLGKAKALLAGPLGAIRRSGRVDEKTFEDVEEALILADVGLPTTTRLLDELRASLRNGEISPEPEVLLGALKENIAAFFVGEDRDLHYGEEPPSVWLFVGVNGVGKTTTIGKLAAKAVEEGKKVVLAAGDTFRAAASDQLDLWAARSGSDIVRGGARADPSSVIFDAVAHAEAIRADLVLADSAGRLHTKVNLMSELQKVRRVADRPPGHLCEVILVIDATTGQNGLAQAREFADAVGITGIALTKLDGTAKGGIVLAIRQELALPVKVVGIGERPEDLVAFDPGEFVTALFG